MPVTGGNVIPQSVDDVSKSYINMVDEQMYKIVDYTVMRLVGRLSNSLWTWKNCIIIRDSYKRINIVEKQF